MRKHIEGVEPCVLQAVSSRRASCGSKKVGDPWGEMEMFLYLYLVSLEL